MTDQNGTIHELDYDKLRRSVADRVVNVGGAIDLAVLRIETSYEVRGNPEKITQYDAVSGGNVVNEVERSYNDFGQLDIEYQEHSDAVNTSTSPKIEYHYADGSANTIRPTEVIYPNSTGNRKLGYDYGTGQNDKLSRVEVVKFMNASVVTPTYLGLGTQVRTTYNEPQVRWDLITGSSPNPYAGLDRFGRVIDNKWTNYSTAATLDQIKYGYDRASNRIWRENVVSKALGTPKYFDEYYSYDGSNRLSLMERGQLAGSPPSSITNKQFAQDWGLDPTGNWKEFKEDETGSGSWSLDQTRASNTVNEITAINETAGPSWVTPGYDAAGNMTTIPRPAEPTGDFTAVYDAWNRLVKLIGLDDTVVAQYDYDGLTRRITKHTFPGWEELEAADWDAMTLENWNGFQLTQAHRRDYFYNTAWQILEERVENESTFNRQYVWGLRYIDELVFRDRQLNSGVERLYALQDANWNVTALVHISGSVVERYSYTAYGVPMFLNPDFTPAENQEAFDWDVLYAGYKWDAESGMYQVRFRYLQSAIGAWGSRDPIGYEVGMSLYRYVLCNPTKYADPLGFEDVEVKIKGPFHRILTQDEWTEAQLEQKRKPIKKCCDKMGDVKSDNCVKIVIWSPGRESNMAAGHVSFGISGDGLKTGYGFHRKGFMDDDKDMEGYAMHSIWECCCYTDDEMTKLKVKLEKVKKRAEFPEEKREAEHKQDLEGEEYPPITIKEFALPGIGGTGPFHTCSGTAASFASGMGCPQLKSSMGANPYYLLTWLRQNDFCWMKERGDWDKYKLIDNPKPK